MMAPDIIPTPGRSHRVLPIGTSLEENVIGEKVLCAWTIDETEGCYWLCRHELEGANSGERTSFAASWQPERAQGAAWRHARLRVFLAELAPEVYG